MQEALQDVRLHIWRNPCSIRYLTAFVFQAAANVFHELRLRERCNRIVFDSAAGKAQSYSLKT